MRVNKQTGEEGMGREGRGGLMRVNKQTEGCGRAGGPVDSGFLSFTAGSVVGVTASAS